MSDLLAIVREHLGAAADAVGGTLARGRIDRAHAAVVDIVEQEIAWDRQAVGDLEAELEELREAAARCTCGAHNDCDSREAE